MLFTTPTQFAILALLFVAGWFFGLASHPGGRKWRERYAAERDAHAASRKEADARIATADQRAREVERDHARLAQAAPVTAATVTPATAAPATVTPAGRPVAMAAARPAYTPGERRGWFDWTAQPRP